VAVIPVHDRPHELTCLLASLNRLNLDSLELTVVVVDDGSPQPISDLVQVELEHAKLSWYRHDRPHGPGYCRNLGAKETHSDYLWFLDSDTEVLRPDTLWHMVRILAADPQLAVVGGVMEESGGVLKVREIEILPNFNCFYRSFLPNTYGSAYVSGLGSCNFLVKREVFRQARGFREKLRRDEDNDLCLAIRDLGYRFYQSKETLIWHKCSQTGRESGIFAHFQDQKIYFKDLLETRLLIMAKHSPWRLPLLPLLDFFLAPFIVYRLKTGVYATERFGMVARDSGSRLIKFLIVQKLQSYLHGFILFLRYLLDPQQAIKPN
jgi:GT2 family glycosyltransferase